MRDDITGLVGWRGDISIDRATVFWLAGNVGMTKWVNWLKIVKGEDKKKREEETTTLRDANKNLPLPCYLF